MSYFGRIAGRAGGAPTLGLAPTGRLASPLARVDQRLNLMVEWGAPLRRGRLGTSESSEGAGKDAFAVAPAPSRPPVSPVLEEAAPRFSAPVAARTVAVDAATSAEPATAPGTAPRPTEAPLPAPLALRDEPTRARSQTTRPAPEAPEDASRRGSERAASGPATTEPVRAIVAPSKPELEIGVAPRTEDLLATPRRARQAATEKVELSPGRSVDAKDHARTRQAATEKVELGGPKDPAAASPAQAAPARSQDFTSALQQALGKVERWMGSDAKQDRGAVADGPREPSARSASTAEPRERAPRRSEAQGAAGRMRAPSVARPVRDLAPRLTIGSIDVRVIPPAPPPVVVQQPVSARASRVAGRTAAGTPSARLPSHLTFGLRQR